MQFFLTWKKCFYQLLQRQHLVAWHFQWNAKYLVDGTFMGVASIWIYLSILKFIFFSLKDCLLLSDLGRKNKTTSRQCNAQFEHGVGWQIWPSKIIHVRYINDIILPHLLPMRTGQAACRVRSSPFPLGRRLYQKAAQPFWGNKLKFNSGKTVAPPASTELIWNKWIFSCTWLFKERVELSKAYVKQPSGYSISPTNTGRRGMIVNFLL